MPEPDPRVIKLVRELDAERTRRIRAERLATSLLAQFQKLKATKTRDAKAARQERR